MATLKNVTISDTAALTVAKGTQAERPTIVSKVQSFSSPGSWTAPTGVSSVEVLVVAGGGGTGWDVGGGGGGGGVLYAQSFPVSAGTPYPISVGTGGASAGSPGTKGTSGGNSTFSSLTAVGGGGGGAYPANGTGIPGGSGGGGGDQFAEGGTGTQSPSGPATGYGFPGGRSGQAWTGAGGGGAGGAGGGAGGILRYQDTRESNLAGGDGSISLPGGWTNYPGSGGFYEGNAALGGPGLTFTITGTTITYSGGGCGMSDGGFIQPTNPNPGWGANGSGEGGTYYPGSPGVVVLRWRTPADTETSGYARFNTTTGAIESNEGSGFSSLQQMVDSRIIKFTEVGSFTWTVPAGVTSVRVLVVAGGGGGCERHGGGGGGGGMLEHFGYPVTPGGSIPVVVGAGGKGLAKPAGNPHGNPGYQGYPSRFGDIITYGGGGGFSDTTNQGDPRATGGSSQLAGGSGGGAAHNGGSSSGTGIPGQGFPGGLASSGGSVNRGVTGPSPGTGNPHAGGGGGGAGGSGEPSRSNSEAGNGGPGRASDITGSIIFYAGGGGGSCHIPTTQGGTGGVGGGGNGGGPGFYQPGVNGLGGGGGGANNDPAPVGGYGGSGVVIIRY